MMTDTESLSSLFRQTITKRLSLDKNGSGYLFEEEGIRYLFASKLADDFGFKLDEDNNFKVFDGKPPSGIAKRCDVIFVVRVKDEDYIIAVEIKSKRQRGYNKQIPNGRLYCQWVVNLLKEHGYYSQEPKYIGLLVWRVNPDQPPKGTTKPFEYATTVYKGITIHKRTEQKIYLHELI